MIAISVWIVFLLLQYSAALPSNLNQRADSDDDPCFDESPIEDGPTSDQSPGIGVELESSRVKFSKAGCSEQETFAAKGEVVGNRKDKDGLWKLTADTTDELAGSLTAEYILSGEKIVIGSNVATGVAAQVSSDLVIASPRPSHSLFFYRLIYIGCMESIQRHAK